MGEQHDLLPLPETKTGYLKVLTRSILRYPVFIEHFLTSTMSRDSL